MIDRLIVIVMLAGLAMAAYRLLALWQVRRAARAALSDPVLAGLRPGVPAILYFTTPACAPCRTQQRPALHNLLVELGEAVQVIEVNALEQADAASRWGVLSVPTTFILDRQGRPRQINHGVAGPDKLKRQLQAL
jgi:thioredoxin-like negative regulator of GroEL